MGGNFVLDLEAEVCAVWCPENWKAFTSDGKFTFLKDRSLNKFLVFCFHVLVSIDFKIFHLGVMIDECLSWKYYIWYICSRMSKDMGIRSKVRYQLTVKQLKQIYHKFIELYKWYVILEWGDTHISFLQEVQVIWSCSLINNFCKHTLYKEIKVLCHCWTC